jgi:phosphatidylethanolamine/phosphatidyl-N-methylethanolamine N-methyltransferase
MTLTPARHPRRKTLPSRSPLYRSLARWYDPIFKPLLVNHIGRTIRSLDIEPGSEVLDVGVGTGNYLGAYPRESRVMGIDSAREMLDVATRRIDQHGLNHVTLRHMDALDLKFDDNSFDYVSSFHTISVVEDARRMLTEMVRVCKPGGRLVIINHFRSENPWVASLLKHLSSMTNHLGWRSDLSFEDLFDTVPLRVQQRHRRSTFALFTIVIGCKLSGSISDHPDQAKRRMGISTSNA